LVDVAEIGAGTVIFLVALFLAALGATVSFVAVRRGMSNDRRHPDEH